MNIDAFSQHLRDNDLAARTVAAYGREVQLFVVWFEQTEGEPLVPALLTPSALSEYRQHLQTVKGYMPATVNRKLLALRAWCGWAVASGQLESDPSARTRLVKENQLQPKSLSPRDLHKLRREVEKAVNIAHTDPARRQAVRNLAIFRLLEYTGVRVGELCGLALTDLELSERAGHLTVRFGKGNKRRRIPLALGVRQALADWLALRPAAGAMLFVGGDGEPLQSRGVQRMLEHHASRAGVKATPHTLRHTFAKSLLNVGEPIVNVAALLGHSRIESTSRYLQPSERDLEKAIDRLED